MKTVLCSAVFFFLLGVGVAARATMEYPFHAVDTSTPIRTPTGFGVPTTFAGRDAANMPVRASRVVSITKSRMGALIKSRMFTPWGVALTAAAIGLEYVLDDGAETVSSAATDYGADDRTAGVGSCYRKATPTGSTSLLGTKTLAECWELGRLASWGEATWNALDNHAWGSVIGSGSPGYCKCTPTKTWGMGWAKHVAPTSPTAGFVPPPWVPAVPLSDSQLYDSMLGEAAPFSEAWKLDQAEGLIWSPPLSRPDPGIAEVAAVAADLNADYAASTDADPLTNPTTDAVADTGLDSVAEGVPVDIAPPPNVQPETATASETNPLCEGSPNIFACVDASEDLEPVDIQLEEMSADYDPVALAGNASCPAPPSVNINGVVQHWNNEPMCDFLSGSSPFVILCCSLLGLFIVYRSFES